MKLLLAFGVSLLLLGCSGSSPEVTDKLAEMKSFLAQPVEERFEQAMTKRDNRLLGVYGFALMVPGVPDSTAKVWSTSEVLPIPGTSDVHGSGLEGKFNAEARSYAERYNAMLLKKSP